MASQTLAGKLVVAGGGTKNLGASISELSRFARLFRRVCGAGLSVARRPSGKA